MTIQIGKYESINYKTEYSCFIKFKYNQTTVDRIKSLPDRKYVASDKVWEIPIANMMDLIDMFGSENIQVFPGVDFPEYYELLKATQIERNDIVVDDSLKGKTVEELQEYYASVEPIVDDYEFKTVPMGHQVDAFNKCLDMDTILITDEMGLGKTKSSIDIMDYKIQRGLVHRVLVVCCVNSIKYNWVREVEKHSYNNVQVIDGTKAKRIKALHNCRDYIYNVINIESLRMPDIMEILEAYFDSEVFDAVIVDEIHRCSNQKSKQGEAIRKIQCNYKIGLTGTPVTKRVERLWNFLNWFEIVRESYWKFTKEYCILGGFTGWDVVGYQNLNELHKRLAAYQIRRTKEILNLPLKTHVYEYVEMTKDEAKEYALIKDGLLRDIESGELEIIDPFVAVLRLRQYTDWIKLKAVKEIVDNIVDNDRACVIFSVFKEPIQVLKEELNVYAPLVITGDTKQGETRQAIVDEFQNNQNRRVMIGTQQAMGTGITLTKSNYVLFLNKNWVVTENEQAEDRCHRIGTKDNVTVITFIVKGTIDERVEEVLASDKRNIDKVVDGKGVVVTNAREILSRLLD